MKLKNSIVSIGLSLLVFLMVSCNDDPGMGKISVKMKAVSANNAFDPYGRVEVSGVTFTAVLLGVTELELETESENEDEINGVEIDETEIEFEGQFILDLINGTSDPELGLADVNIADYNEIEIDLTPIVESAYSIKIKGKYTPEGGVETEFIYTYDLSLELEIEKEGSNFNIPDGGTSNLLILLDLDQIFDGIAFDNAVADANDGIIYLKRGNENESIAVQIEDAFLDAFSCGEDNDDDDEIDD